MAKYGMQISELIGTTGQMSYETVAGSFPLICPMLLSCLHIARGSFSVGLCSLSQQLLTSISQY